MNAFKKNRLGLEDRVGLCEEEQGVDYPGIEEALHQKEDKLKPHPSGAAYFFTFSISLNNFFLDKVGVVYYFKLTERSVCFFREINDQERSYFTGRQSAVFGQRV